MSEVLPAYAIMQFLPNLTTTLKAEISRVARKELKSELESLRKAASLQRSEIAALKKRTVELERQTRQLSRPAKVAMSRTGDEEGGSRLRFQAKGFASLRKKLGLSAHDMGRLLNVSSLSIYKWESGKTAPRSSHLPAIAAVRKLGKREALEKLANL